MRLHPITKGIFLDEQRNPILCDHNRRNRGVNSICFMRHAYTETFVNDMKESYYAQVII